MPELRRDELTGRWVLIAPQRAARPHTFPPPPPGAEPPAGCPFCPGHEAMTPPEVHRTGDGEADAPGWRVRVVPNLYPVVGGPEAAPGATGAHEVVVLSPAHDRSLAQLSDEQAVEVVAVLRDRVRFHLAAGRTYVQALINHGRAAGASIEHPHAQVVALDVVPPAVDVALARVTASGRDLVAVAPEASEGSPFRVSDGPVPVWCPRASSTPYELRLAHPSAGPRFDEATDQEVAPVALAMRDALARLATVLGDAPYNLAVHTAPPAVTTPFFHWYIEVQPRITVVAAFEQSTGILVNITPPELAAAQLRDLDAGR